MKLTAGSHPAGDRERVDHGDDSVGHVTYETAYCFEEYSCKLSAGGDSGLGDAVALVPRVNLFQAASATPKELQDDQS